MSYYGDRKRAIMDIDNMLKDGKQETEIVNIMQLRYGFDKTIVAKRILILADLGVISIRDGIIKMLKKNVPK